MPPVDGNKCMCFGQSADEVIDPSGTVFSGDFLFRPGHHHKPKLKYNVIEPENKTWAEVQNDTSNSSEI